MGKKSFNFASSPVANIAEEIRDKKNIPVEEKNAETPKEKPASVPHISTESADEPAVESNDNNTNLKKTVVYSGDLKGISVKIPYEMYDALDYIKKRTQRTGDRRDKMGIGDLVVQAIKEFLDRNLS